MANTTSQSTNQNEALKNLVIVLGITILLVAGVIGAGLVISRVTESSTETDDGIIASQTDDEVINVEEDGEIVIEDNQENEEAYLEADEIIFEDVTEDEVDQLEADEVIEEETVISQTASAGDSFSWLSRRAMYQYMGDRGLGLDVGGRLYFEVTLTNMVRTSALNAGDVIDFEISNLDTVFYNASNLDSVTHTAWIHQAEAAGYL